MVLFSILKISQRDYEKKKHENKYKWKKEAT